jgi:membrane fusion protein (multidrug efflux system)
MSGPNGILRKMKECSEMDSPGVSRRSLPLLAAGLFALAALSGCDEAPAETQAEAAPPEVSVVTLHQSAQPYIRELPGRLAPTRIAQVRARVSGIIVARPFSQGSDVKAGDVLYQIDPQPFQVELKAAEAALAKAESIHHHATQQAHRMQTLVGEKAVSQVQYETAQATMRQAAADVEARRADVERAKLNLDYATVRSPINGRVGRALVTEGALVGQGEATHLVTVQQIDRIYADFTQSVNELIQLRKDFESGALERVSPDAVKVHLVLDDGTTYPYPGRLLFSEATVDPSTGQVTLRGEFPNPKNELLPGMYVRVRIEQGIDGDALSVPQQAVQRNSAGGSEVYVVRDNRVVLQPIRTGQIVDDKWIVTDGLKAGDHVVVEGFQKIGVGMTVKPMPWKAKLRSARADGIEDNATVVAR